MSRPDFRYVRIQGKEFARNTMHAKGIFSMFAKLIQNEVMDEEDTALYNELSDWFSENLPWPPQCRNQEPVICWFKTENSDEMMKMIRPMLWLLERYDCPYYLVYTNTPGEIVYEDKYQIAARVDGFLHIDEVQPSWSPEEEREDKPGTDAGLIARTEEFLKRKFDESEYFSSHEDEKTYRLEHSYRVANIGLQIARAEGLDQTATVVACLLHDVAYCEGPGEGGWREHGRRSAAIARPFLCGLGLPQDLINEILYGIAIHVDDEADFEGERTPLALTVGDADNIDRFDAFRIHETLSREGFLDMSAEERKDHLEKRLARLRELFDLKMGTKNAEELWRERLSYYISFYEKLLSQQTYGTGIIDG